MAELLTGFDLDFEKLDRVSAGAWGLVCAGQKLPELKRPRRSDESVEAGAAGVTVATSVGSYHLAPIRSEPTPTGHCGRLPPPVPAGLRPRSPTCGAAS